MHDQSSQHISFNSDIVQKMDICIITYVDAYTRTKFKAIKPRTVQKRLYLSHIVVQMCDWNLVPGDQHRDRVNQLACILKKCISSDVFQMRSLWFNGIKSQNIFWLRREYHRIVHF